MDEKLKKVLREEFVSSQDVIVSISLQVGNKTVFKDATISIPKGTELGVEKTPKLLEDLTALTYRTISYEA